eukprot:COSAG01_NODE_7702_length_3092_cov_2.293351_5_plen_113_part_01
MDGPALGGRKIGAAAHRAQSAQTPVTAPAPEPEQRPQSKLPTSGQSAAESAAQPGSSAAAVAEARTAQAARQEQLAAAAGPASPVGVEGEDVYHWLQRKGKERYTAAICKAFK